MKRMFCLLLFFSLLLCGCAQNEKINMQSATILIIGGHGNNPCVFKVRSDGILEVTTGPLETVRFGEAYYTDEDYFTEEALKKTKRLSKRDRASIDTLISQVKETGDPEYTRPEGADDGVVIYATIDNIEYTALYKNDIIFSGEKNAELSDLAEILVDISPVKIKGF